MSNRFAMLHQGFPQVLRTWGGGALQDFMGGYESIHGGAGKL